MTHPEVSGYLPADRGMPERPSVVAFLALPEAPADALCAWSGEARGPVGKRGQHGIYQRSTFRRLRSASDGGLLHAGEVLVPAQPVPVVVTCHLCPDPDDGHIVTISDRAWLVAMDHALDEHRAALLADPENAVRSFTVNTTGRPQLLRAPERVEATR